MNGDSTPVTRTQLREELARYPTRDELREELARFVTKDEFGQLVQTIAQQHETSMHWFAKRHEELLREISRSARVAAEEHRREVGVLDDRYRDLPDRLTTLERTLDAHTRDRSLHQPRPPHRPRRR